MSIVQYIAGVCGAVPCRWRDQHEDMPEWLDWHLSLGVDRIYVFDDGSIPPLNETLQQYIDAQVVEYHYIMKITHFSGKAQLQVRPDGGAGTL